MSFNSIYLEHNSLEKKKKENKEKKEMIQPLQWADSLKELQRNHHAGGNRNWYRDYQLTETVNRPAFNGTPTSCIYAQKRVNIQLHCV